MKESVATSGGGVASGEAPPSPQAMQERLRQLEGQLLQSEKLAAIGQLAAGVAHEINNPVGFINSNLGSLSIYIDRLLSLIAAYEQVETCLPSDHPSRQALTRLRSNAELDYLRQDIPDLLRESADGLARVKRIIGDLKDFCRSDEGQWESVDLHRGLESTLNVIWNEIKYKAQIVREFGELPLVRCLPGQINQVFMNLLVNAAQAIEGSGIIRLRTGVEGELVWVEISDTGRGIPQELRERIFDPFFTTKPAGKGTGLGLSISRDIVRRHSGSISFHSTSQEGTTFRVELPIGGPPACQE